MQTTLDLSRLHVNPTISQNVLPEHDFKRRHRRRGNLDTSSHPSYSPARRMWPLLEAFLALPAGTCVISHRAWKRSTAE
jgi:hypothetical protein